MAGKRPAPADDGPPAKRTCLSDWKDQTIHIQARLDRIHQQANDMVMKTSNWCLSLMDSHGQKLVDEYLGVVADKLFDPLCKEEEQYDQLMRDESAAKVMFRELSCGTYLADAIKRGDQLDRVMGALRNMLHKNIHIRAKGLMELAIFLSQRTLNHDFCFEGLAMDCLRLPVCVRVVRNIWPRLPDIPLMETGIVEKPILFKPASSLNNFGLLDLRVNSAIQTWKDRIWHDLQAAHAYYPRHTNGMFASRTKDIFIQYALELASNNKVNGRINLPDAVSSILLNWHHFGELDNLFVDRPSTYSAREDDCMEDELTNESGNESDDSSD